MPPTFPRPNRRAQPARPARPARPGKPARVDLGEAGGAFGRDRRRGRAGTTLHQIKWGRRPAWPPGGSRRHGAVDGGQWRIEQECGPSRAGSGQTGRPRTGAPRPGAPRTGAPRPGAPRTGAPRTGAPRTGAPRTDSLSRQGRGQGAHPSRGTGRGSSPAARSGPRSGGDLRGRPPRRRTTGTPAGEAPRGPARAYPHTRDDEQPLPGQARTWGNVARRARWRSRGATRATSTRTEPDHRQGRPGAPASRTTGSAAAVRRLRAVPLPGSGPTVPGA